MDASQPDFDPRDFDSDDDDSEIEDETLNDSSMTDRNDVSHITCHFCKGIIEYALRFRRLDEEHFLSEIPQFHMAKEDNRGDLAERAKTCRVCAMALSAIHDQRSSQNRATAPMASEKDPHECEVWWEFCRPRSKYDRPMLAVVDFLNGTALFKFRETLGLFLRSFPQAESESMKQSEYVSYDVLRRWYQNCLNHGGALQDLSLFDELQSTTIRLIDVEDNRLCEVPTSEPYLALSYVWGTSPGDSDKLTTKNFEKLYVKNGIANHVNLTRTVRDAIEVTKGLRVRYLFVDRLCIVQDSSKDKALYVEAMHEIYNKANITIVAAAGTSAQAGLPGTRGTPRTHNRLYSPRQFVNIDVERDLVRVHEDEFPPSDLLQEHLEKSTWASRGWTFQEEKLSERMLVFTDQAVFWKCSHICLYEDCPHDPHEHLSKGLVDMQATDPFGRDPLWWGRKKKTALTVNGKPTDFASLTGHDSVGLSQTSYVGKRDLLTSVIFRLRVQEFCQRTLTYQDDIARAFNGMIGAFKLIYEPLPIHHGMLTRSLPSELTWACAGCVDESHTTHMEHLGLRSVTNSLGVPNFPTWSWHAWQDQPSWINNQRRPKCSMREMDEETAMTTSMYAGFINPPCSELIYQETRKIEWCSNERQFTPTLWMTQHPLYSNALIFMALAYRADQPFERRSGQKIESLTKLKDLGLGLPGSRDVPIVEWLQRPSGNAFERPLGMICLSYIDNSSKAGSVSRMAVMMLLSYKTVEGKVVAFREGLFTCEASDFRIVQKFFRPSTIFLC